MKPEKVDRIIRRREALQSKLSPSLLQGAELSPSLLQGKEFSPSILQGAEQSSSSQQLGSPTKHTPSLSRQQNTIVALPKKNSAAFSKGTKPPPELSNVTLSLSRKDAKSSKRLKLAVASPQGNKSVILLAPATKPPSSLSSGINRKKVRVRVSIKGGGRNFAIFRLFWTKKWVF